MIYFMQPTDGGPVKIGTTSNLTTRRKQLETYYGKPLAVLATMDGGRQEEAAVHARFAHLRLGKRTRPGVRPEQFRPASELMEFIGRPLLVSPNPEAVEVMKPMGSATVINLKGSDEYIAWLDEAHGKTRLSKATLVRLGLELVAREYKLKPPPEI